MSAPPFIQVPYGRFRCQSGELALGQQFTREQRRSYRLSAAKSVGGVLSKNTAFDREIEGRAHCFFSPSGQPPSVSSVSLRLLRMQVKIGVSRNV